MGIERIMSAIAEIRNNMVRSNALENPVLMSEYMIRLAQLNHMLGENLANMTLEAKRMKASKFEGFRRDHSSLNQCEILVRFDTDCAEAESKVVKLETVVKQTNNLISACQSHIKVKLAEAGQQV